MKYFLYILTLALIHGDTPFSIYVKSQSVQFCDIVIMSALQCESQSAYALTEFVVFALGGLVFAAMLAFFGLLFFLFRNNDKVLGLVQGAHRFVIRTVFSGSEDLVEVLYPRVDQKPKRIKARSTWGKVAVYVYFTLLSGLVALWYLAVFSDSLFYRKTGTCNDLGLNDKEYSCFLISDPNVPPQVQEIIDKEEGEIVPCQKVQQFLASTPNVTYDLEVICYVSQLTPLSAMGVAYGASKIIAFLLQFIFKGFMFLAAKGRVMKRLLVAFQVTILSFVIAFVLVVPPTLHEVSGPRNSPFDFLRGERFYPYAVITLLGLSTVLVAGLTPWWAFESVSYRDLLCFVGNRESSSDDQEADDSQLKNYNQEEEC